jgi:NitT/TauT family transport system substrate-binding protein
MRRHRLSLLLIGIAFSLVVTACGDSGEDTTTTTAAPGTTGAETTTTTTEAPMGDRIRVAYVPVNDAAPLFWAENLGMYEDAGLDVELVSVPSGEAVNAAIASGDVDIGVTSTVPILAAYNAGFPLRIVTGLSTNVPEGPQDSGGAIMSMADSGIDTVAAICEVDNPRASAGAPGSLARGYFRAALRMNGCDPDTVEYIPMPPADAGAALINGDIHVVYHGEPAVTDTLAKGGQVLSWTFREVTGPSTPIAYMVANQSWAEEHADDIRALKGVWSEAIDMWADEANRDQFLDILVEWAAYAPPRDVLEQIQIATLTMCMDIESLRRVERMMVDERLLPAETRPLEDLVFETATC